MVSIGKEAAYVISSRSTTSPFATFAQHVSKTFITAERLLACNMKQLSSI